MHHLPIQQCTVHCDMGYYNDYLIYGVNDPTGNAPVDHSATAVSIQAHTPHEWVPLKVTNPQFEKHLIERHNLPAVDFLATNKVGGGPSRCCWHLQTIVCGFTTVVANKCSI